MQKLRWRLTAILLAGIFLLFSGCSLMPEEDESLAPPLIEPEAFSYKTAKVEKGHIERLLKGTATAQSYDETSYYFELENGTFKNICVSVGDAVEAGTLLAEIDSGDLDLQIKQMEITRKKQHLELSNLQSKYASAADADARRDLKLQIDLMNLDLESTNLSYAQLQEKKAATQLVASNAGIVTYISHAYDPGDPVSAYETLVTVADPQKLCFYYESASASEASKGMAVTYTYSGVTFTGEVLQSPKDVPANSDAQSALVMSGESIPSGIKWGDMVEFSIIVAESDDALMIPRSALTEYSTKYYVDVLDGESKYNTEVSIGIVGATDVQIVSGVEEGAEVIVG